MPLDSTSSNPLERAMPIDHGSMAREVQSQVSSLSSSLSVGRDAAVGSLVGADSALGALPGAGAEQTVSPLLNMITKMPGHIGFFSSMFEVLGAFLAPQLEALTNLGMSLGFDPSILGHLSLGLPEHMGMDLSLLPADAPILGMNGLKDMAQHGLSADVLSSKLNASLGHGNLLAHNNFGSMQESLNISAPGNLLNKPVFEGGHLSGPSLGQSQPAPQLAGNNRIFSDSIGSSGHNLSGQSMGLAQNQPATNSGNLNVNGSTFGSSDPAADLNVSGQDSQLLAMGGGESYQSTVGSMKTSDVGTAENLGGMKAKALSLDSNGQLADVKAHGLDIKHDLKHDIKDVKDTAKTDIKEAKVEPRTHKTFDRTSHSLKPSHHTKAVESQAQATQPANQHQAPSQAKPAKVAAKPAAAEAQKTSAQGNAQADMSPAQESKLQAQEAPQQAQQEIAQAQPQADMQNQRLDSTAPGATGSDKLLSGQGLEARTYTIRSGDCLWNIAKDQLGSAAKWSDIYKMNSDILGVNPDLIRPGTTIQLPGAGSEVANVAQYTVKPGDNLWDIAKNQLGDGTKWSDLYKNNQDIIGANPRLIQPGQTLNIGASTQISAAPAQSGLTVANQTNVSPQLQPPMQAQLQAKVPESYGAETLTTQQSSLSSYDAVPVNHQVSPPANLGAAKVMPAQTQPDAMIQPAHAASADEIIIPSANIGDAARADNTASVVSTNLANDMMGMLKKKR